LFNRAAILIFVFITGSILSCQSQPSNNAISKRAKPLTGMPAAAYDFLQTLSADQRKDIVFEIDSKERFNWHYIPRSRKGIPLKELNAAQRKAAMRLLSTALSDTGYTKTKSIIDLEAVLREAEGRPVDDNYRDAGNYYFTIFGNPATDSIWGWRLEGHHISLNFSAAENRLLSGTPGFLGTNPAIILSGPEKGKHILKDETDLGLAMLNSLDEEQKRKAVRSEEH